ncbi:MFS transporter [Dethiosulfatarculus sandiegensis]|uniref:MFS transporter n=1 Tax=Dethiosulfatarculus sandiegensis TaxID=1429043 RepID=A0A0D2HNG1_9BACT|nr:MFS transporter [Dethiosulfatarculus sandiegensis]KIX12088.1 MFS transporter [Dethiosulfatarculus sandiegensis]
MAAIDKSKTDYKVLFALFLVHFSGDLYSSFINPLLPALADKLTLTLTQVGLLTGVVRVLSFVIQPTVGYLADRYRTKFFVLGGPLLAVIFTPLIGILPSYLLVMLSLSISSVGSSMFHPTAAAMVSDYSGKKSGMGMAIFIFGGTLAFGIGPVGISWYVETLGLENLPFTMLPGIVLFIILFIVVPTPETEGLANMGFWGAMKDAFGHVWRPILLIWIMVVIRTLVSQSFMTFMPMLMDERGYSITAVGGIVSLFTVAGAASGLISGHLADRMGDRPMFYASFGLSAPALLAFLYLPGPWVYVGSFVSGFFVMATLPLAVSLAQHVAPKGKSLVSSLMMGLAFGVGGMLTPVVGYLSDLFGITNVLVVLSLIPLLVVYSVRNLPDRN